MFHVIIANNINENTKWVKMNMINKTIENQLIDFQTPKMYRKPHIKQDRPVPTICRSFLSL